MDLSELINKCLFGDLNDYKYTGSMIANHTVSDYYTYCEYFAPQEEKDPESLYLQLLAEKGNKHEINMIEKTLPVRKNISTDNIQAFKICIEEMIKGTRYLAGFPIYYVPFKYEGHTDLLRRSNSHSSVFGNYHYEILEIKLAKKIKKKHIMQAIFYNEIIGQIQGYFPENVFLVNGEFKEVPYAIFEFKDELSEILKDITSIRTNTKIPTPVYNSVPHPWSNYANKQAADLRDITLIPDIGIKMRGALNNKGIFTIEDINKSSIESLKNVENIKDKRAKAFKNHSKAFSTGIPVKKIPVYQLENKIEHFIDFEGVDPTLSPIEGFSFDFLYGVIFRDNNSGKKEYKQFLVENPFDDVEMKSTAEKFIDYLLLNPTAPIYHWASYERTRIKKLFEYYDINTEKKIILDRFTDLHKKVRESWAFPIPSYSIKNVANHFGFKWRIEEMEGRKTIATYVKYILEDIPDQSELEKIINYNQDDIEAILFLKDKLFTDKISFEFLEENN